MEDMVAESIKYTVLGMGVVFTFLYILVLLLRLQKIVIGHFLPEEVAKSTSGKDEAARRRKRVAAMTAAIEHHKRICG